MARGCCLWFRPVAAVQSFRGIIPSNYWKTIKTGSVVLSPSEVFQHLLFTLTILVYWYLWWFCPAYIFLYNKFLDQYISHFQHQTVGPVVFTVTVTVKVALDGRTYEFCGDWDGHGCFITAFNTWNTWNTALKDATAREVISKIQIMFQSYVYPLLWPISDFKEKITLVVLG